MVTCIFLLICQDSSYILTQSLSWFCIRLVSYNNGMYVVFIVKNTIQTMVCQAIEPTRTLGVRSRLCYSLRRRRSYLYSTILVFEYGRISHPTFVFNINVEDNSCFVWSTFRLQYEWNFYCVEMHRQSM